VYGDLSLARAYFTKIAEWFESMDVRTDPTFYAPIYYCILTVSSSYVRWAGLEDLVLRLVKACHCGFSEVEETTEMYFSVMKFFTWETAKVMSGIICPDNVLFSLIRPRR
jgi:hypothetical protein